METYLRDAITASRHFTNAAQYKIRRCQTAVRNITHRLVGLKSALGTGLSSKSELDCFLHTRIISALALSISLSMQKNAPSVCRLSLFLLGRLRLSGCLLAARWRACEGVVVDVVPEDVVRVAAWCGTHASGGSEAAEVRGRFGLYDIVSRPVLVHCVCKGAPGIASEAEAEVDASAAAGCAVASSESLPKVAYSVHRGDMS